MGRKVIFDDLVPGLKVIYDGEIWIVMDCSDLHNVHLVKEGTGITINYKGDELECGCSENTEHDYPVYLI